MKTLAIIAYIFLFIGVNLLLLKHEETKSALDECTQANVLAETAPTILFSLSEYELYGYDGEFIRIDRK